MIGQTIAHFRITEKLGSGGMGIVYAAEDLKLGRNVALKFLPESLARNAAALERFDREARAASTLNHPNICTIYEIGEHEGQVFLAMELLEGRTLREIIAQHPPPEQCLDIGLQISSALEAAHAKGIIHRDIKPANIIVTPQGQAKLLDFGLAKVAIPTSDATVEQLTMAGAAVGTLAYMSPEQRIGAQTDARSDLYSLGATLYEMATGRLPVEGDPQVLPAALAPIIYRCLKKDPAARYQTAGELLLDLKRAGPTARTVKSSRRGLVAVALFLIVALLAAGGLLWRRNRQIRWATETALPQVMQFADKDENFAAFVLARQIERSLPGDPILSRIWPQISRVITIETTPAGADVYRKPYATPQAEWEHLGRTPIRDLRIPRGFSRWKISLEGYEGLEMAGNVVDSRLGTAPPETLQFALAKPGDIPEGMVRVAGGSTVLQIPGLEGIPPVTIPDYFIDRYEVTNRQFKEFVDRGGYQKPEFWKQPFVKGGRILPWNEAMTLFRDKTGKPGPAGWELSEYAAGQAEYPVVGISWHEAAAYAEFAHKSLPTGYQWSRAAGTRTSASMIPFSNFSGQALTPRGASQALSPAGIYDTAGNAKEWCWNPSGEGYLILGGGFNEPAYMFNAWDSKSPFERGAVFGVRLVQPVPGLDSPKAALDPVPTAFRDYRKEKPVSDAVFQIFKSLYAYDKTPLSPKVEAVEDAAEWRWEKVSYRAGYGDERILAHVLIPKRSSPPYQTVVFFPGSGALQQTSSVTASGPAGIQRFDYLVKSGRALILPIYKGTYERHDELASDHPVPSGLYRDHVIMWSKDLGRTIDYVETRTDLDARKVAYYGLSWGGNMGAILPALEPRVKVVVVESGGLYGSKTLPEVDQINFPPHVKAPVLMVNAHYDHFFPLETSQIPLFHFFGAPEKDKRRVVEEGWHVLPRHLVIREALPWLDRYLGPVK